MATRPQALPFIHRTLRRARPLARVGAAALLWMMTGCGRAERAPAPTLADAELARAWAEVRGLAGRPAEALTDEQVVTLGYVERLRLGLGSPFRLIDFALQDPRLTPTTRTRAAAALLQATREGRAYATNPLALATVGADAAGRAPERARMHLALIDEAVGRTADPRVGELAVRAAYQLAAAENRVSQQALVVAAQAAAQARDRVLARRDAERLLAAAERGGRHPLALLREWRAARRFQVEAPMGAGRPAELELEASALALPLASRVRAVTAGRGGLERERVPIPRLSAAAAGRLTLLARAQNPPPSAPIQVTLDRYAAELRRTAGATSAGSKAVEQLLARGRTEERFAAELARLADELDPHPPAALVALEAAVDLRAYAQEAVWYPGFPVPATADLRRTYGLAAVTFAEEVPVHWRPYYQRMLGESLADLEAVLPGLDLHGLSFHVGPTGREGALAVHFPGRRVIHLPPGTGPGTIAHEVAHDLDWQVARARYRRRGVYATDLAKKASRTDPFATLVRRLPLVTGPRPGPEGRREDTRPAEAFARLFDGYVTSILALRGRSNGYLSSLQDEVLTGHGTAVPPDARGEGVETFLPLLMIASPLPEAREAEFRVRWGQSRAPAPLSLLADVAASARPELPAPRRRAWRSLADRASLDPAVRQRIAEVEQVRNVALRARAEAVCANPLLSSAEAEEGVRALVDAAAEARVNAILRRFATARGIDAEPDALRVAWLPPPAQPPLLSRTC